MKTPILKKLIIPSFVLLIGGSLAGTVSSTVAWFQYATRAQVAYVGGLSHCSKLLKISVDNGAHWGSDYYQNDMASHIQGNKLIPITTGVQLKNAALDKFYKQPEAGLGGTYDHWLEANSSNYARFEILVKSVDVDGADTETRLVNDVYINKLVIEDDSTNGTGSDLSDSIRVHLAVTSSTGTSNFLFAKSVTETVVGGTLDLNDDGKIDKSLDSWGVDDCIYGVEGGKQTSYKINDTSVISEDLDNPSGVSIGKTGDVDMRIVVTTWIEGWSKLDHGLENNASGETDTPIWDPTSYIGKQFNVGIRLGVKSHDSDHQN